MTANNRKLNEALRVLALDNQPEAPLTLEKTLRAEFRRRRNRKRIGIALAAMGSIAAGLLVLALVRGTTDIGSPAPHLATIAAPPVSTQLKVASVRKPRRVTVKHEMVAEFHPLPGADTLAPFEYGSVVRVELPITAGPEPQRVQADVLLGQDGMARAVRFIP